ncbi:hypothetical protein Emag_005550 [Eimeria magna]
MQRTTGPPERQQLSPQQKAARPIMISGPGPIKASELPLPGLLEGENPSLFSLQQAKHIKNIAKRILKWKRDDFPGGQPVSLSMQNVTDRLSCVCKPLVLFADGQVREIADMYLPRSLDLTESQEMTLLDGELVMDRRDSGGFIWRYLIYDCIAVDGNEEIQKLNLLQRLHAAKKFVTEPVARLREVQQRESAAFNANPNELPFGFTDTADGNHNNTFAFESSEIGPKEPPMEIYLKARKGPIEEVDGSLFCKTSAMKFPAFWYLIKSHVIEWDFFEIFDLEAIRRLALRLPHPSDGIIFTPVKLPYVTGTCPLLLKWKPPHLNTGVRTFAGLILAPFGEFYKELYDMACRGSAGGVIVECFWRPTAPVFTFYPALRERPSAREEQRWNSRNQGHPFYDFDRGEWREGGWVAERIRTDKAMPNDVKVLVSVKRSIDDGVSFATLQHEIERFKQHKKRRVAELCKGVADIPIEEN